MIVGLVAAAALAGVDPAIESDLRCMGVFAIAVAHSEGMTESEKSGVIGAMMFYVGRIEGRQPDFPTMESLRELTTTQTYRTEIQADAERCSAEMKAKAGKLSAFGKIIKEGREAQADPDK